ACLESTTFHAVGCNQRASVSRMEHVFMARHSKSPAQIRPRQTAPAVLRARASQNEQAPQPSPRVTAARDAQNQDSTPLYERATQQLLAVTYWFEPEARPQPYPVTVRFSGRRLGVEGPAQRADTFVHEKTITEVVPGSGPIALTARVRDINPG